MAGQATSQDFGYAGRRGLGLGLGMNRGQQQGFLRAASRGNLDNFFANHGNLQRRAWGLMEDGAGTPQLDRFQDAYVMNNAGSAGDNPWAGMLNQFRRQRARRPWGG